MNVRTRFLLVTLAFSTWPHSPLHAQVITTADLRIQGMTFTVVDTAVSVPADTPAVIQTELGGKRNEAASFIAGAKAVGELTGPGISSPILLEIAPGYAFQIPALPTLGTYILQNIRLVRGAELLQYASPSTALINVTDSLKTEVTVRQLSPEELRARGIMLDPRNFDVFGLVRERTLADGKTLRYQYDALGNLRQSIDEAGEITRYEPDSLGRIKKTIYADGTSEEVVYEADTGVVAAQRDRANQWLSYTRDAGGRIVKVSAGQDPVTSPALVRNGYDAAGRVFYF